MSVRCGTLSNTWSSSQSIDYILVVYKCMVFIVVQKVKVIKASFLFLSWSFPVVDVGLWLDGEP